MSSLQTSRCGRSGVGRKRSNGPRKTDAPRRSYRLTETSIPSEVRPLVRGIIGALHRLDQAYDRHQRFILDAAYELRTPVAILQTRLDSLAAGPDRDRLISDCEKISALAEQLLDLQRLEANAKPLATVDLVGLCRDVAADLGPLTIDQGYEFSFEPNVERALTQGDPASLARAITNLIQNAIEHAGNQGTIVVRVERKGVIEICDDGPGIPEAERERVFDRTPLPLCTMRRSATDISHPIKSDFD